MHESRILFHRRALQNAAKCAHSKNAPTPVYKLYQHTNKKLAYIGVLQHTQHAPMPHCKGLYCYFMLHTRAACMLGLVGQAHARLKRLTSLHICRVHHSSKSKRVFAVILLNFDNLAYMFEFWNWTFSVERDSLATLRWFWYTSNITYSLAGFCTVVQIENFVQQV